MTTPGDVRSQRTRIAVEPHPAVNVGDSLTRTAAARPTQLAVVDGDRELTYAEFDAWVEPLAHGLRPAGCGRGDALGARLGQQRRVPRRLLRLREDRRGLRADQPGLARRRGRLRARALPGPRASSSRPSSPARWARRRGGARRHRGRRRCRAWAATYRAEPADRLWVTLADLEADDDSRPRRCVADREPLSYLYTSGTTSFPKGVVGEPPGRSTSSRCRPRSTPAGARRPVHRDDADVPHRAAQRVLHARGDRRRDDPRPARLRPGGASSTPSSASGSPRSSGCR